MSNQAKEGFWVIALTLCHAAITVCNLGSMPFIVFYHIRKTGLIALVLWTLYAVILYLLSIRFSDNRILTVKDFPKAIIFGVLFSLSMGIVETVIDRIFALFPYAPIALAIETQVEVLVVGLLLFSFLQCKVLKRKACFKKSNLKVPLTAIVIVIVIYAAQVIQEFLKYREVAKDLQPYTTEWYNVETYYGCRILNHNIWSYVVLYFLFWWLIQRLCIKEEK
jgi:hypothetical protein